MYLRFVTLGKDVDSKKKQGLITYVYDLRDEGELDRYELEAVNRIIDWFKEHVKIPPILKRNDSNRCISWFKPEAEQPIKYMWELYYMLQAKGVAVEVLKEEKIGNIKYEDEWQVVAQPLRHNRKIKK